MILKLDEKSYPIYAVKSHTAICLDVDEFNADISIVKRVKSNLGRKHRGTDVDIRLVVNQIITLTNVFKRDAVVRMLFYVCGKHLHGYLISIFDYLGILNPKRQPEVDTSILPCKSTAKELATVYGSRS